MNRGKLIPPEKVVKINSASAPVGASPMPRSKGAPTIIDKNESSFSSLVPGLSEKYNRVPGIICEEDPFVGRPFIKPGDMERIGTLYIVSPDGATTAEDYEVFISVGVESASAGESKRIFKKLDGSSGVQRFVLDNGTEVAPDEFGRLKLVAGPNMFVKENPAGGVLFESTGGGTGGGISKITASGSVTATHSGTTVTLVGLGLSDIETDGGDSIPISGNKIKAIVKVFATKAQFKMGPNNELQLDLPPVFTSVSDGTTVFKPTEVFQELKFKSGDLTVPVISATDGSVKINVDAVAAISVAGKKVDIKNKTIALVAGANIGMVVQDGVISISSTGGSGSGGVDSLTTTGSVGGNIRGRTLSLDGSGLTSIKTDDGDVDVAANQITAKVSSYENKNEFVSGTKGELDLHLKPSVSSFIAGAETFTPSEAVQNLTFTAGDHSVPVIDPTTGSVKINVTTAGGGIDTVNSSGSVTSTLVGSVLTLAGTGLRYVKTSTGELTITSNTMELTLDAYSADEGFAKVDPSGVKLNLKPAIQYVSSGAKTFTPSQAVPGLKLAAGTGVNIDVDETAGSVTIGASGGAGGGIEKFLVSGKDVLPNPTTKAVTLASADKYLKIGATGSTVSFSSGLAPFLDDNVYVVEERQVSLRPVSFVYAGGEIDPGGGKFYNVSGAQCSYCLYNNGKCIVYLFASVVAKKLGEFKAIKGIVFDGFPFYGDPSVYLQQGPADYQGTDVRNIPYTSKQNFPRLIDGGSNSRIYLGANSQFIVFSFPKNTISVHKTIQYSEISTAYLSGSATYWVKETGDLPVFDAGFYDKPIDGVLLSADNPSTGEKPFVYKREVGDGYFVFGSTFPGYTNVLPTTEAWLDVEKFLGTTPTFAMLNCYSENAYFMDKDAELCYGSFLLQEPALTARLRLYGTYTDGAKCFKKGVQLASRTSNIGSLSTNFYGFYDEGVGRNDSAELVINDIPTGKFATGYYGEDSRIKGLGVCSLYWDAKDFTTEGGLTYIKSSYDPAVPTLYYNEMFFGWFSDEKFKPPYVDVDATWGDLVMLANRIYMIRGTRALDMDTPLRLTVMWKGYWMRYYLQAETYQSLKLGFHGFVFDPDHIKIKPNSFKPSVKGSVYAGDKSISYTAQSGFFKLISSDLALFSFVLRWSNFEGLGKLLITGFPFTLSKTVRYKDRFHHLADRNMIGRVFPVDITLRRSTHRVETLDSIVAVIYDENSILLRSTRTVEIPDVLSFFILSSTNSFSFEGTPQILREGLLGGPPNHRMLSSVFNLSETPASDAGTLTCETTELKLLVYYASITKFLEQGSGQAWIWLQEGGGTTPKRGEAACLGNVNYGYESKGPAGSMDLLCATTVTDGLQVACWIESGYSDTQVIPIGKCGLMNSAYMINLPIIQSIYASTKNITYQAGSDSPTPHIYADIKDPATGHLTFDGETLENASNIPVFIMVQVITRTVDAANVELDIDVYSNTAGYSSDHTSSGTLLVGGSQTGTTLLHFLPMVPGDQMKINQRWGDTDFTCESESISVIEFDVGADFYMEGIIDGWVPGTYGYTLLDFSMARITNLSGLKAFSNRVVYDGPGSILLFVSAYIPVIRPVKDLHSFSYGAYLTKYDSNTGVGSPDKIIIQERSSVDSEIKHRVFLSFIVEMKTRDYLEFYFDNFAKSDSAEAYRFDEGFYTFSRLDGNFGSPLASKGYATTYADVDSGAIIQDDIYVSGMLPVESTYSPDEMADFWLGTFMWAGLKGFLQITPIITSKSILVISERGLNIRRSSKKAVILLSGSMYSSGNSLYKVAPDVVDPIPGIDFTRVSNVEVDPEDGSIFSFDSSADSTSTFDLGVALLDFTLVSKVEAKAVVPINKDGYFPFTLGTNPEFISGNVITNTRSSDLFFVVSVDGHKQDGKFILKVVVEAPLVSSQDSNPGVFLLRLSPGEKIKIDGVSGSQNDRIDSKATILLLEHMNNHPGNPLLSNNFTAATPPYPGLTTVSKSGPDEIDGFTIAADNQTIEYNGKKSILVWVQCLKPAPYVYVKPAPFYNNKNAALYTLGLESLRDGYFAIIRPGDSSKPAWAGKSDATSVLFSITQLDYADPPVPSPPPPAEDFEDVIEREPTRRERSLTEVWRRPSRDDQCSP